ncbi:MAG: transglycosylase SLT domain-containing protein [Treponema sp.]|jgi:membrane-bound lytic murein transglycosylase D|nr:transglycosylase SLT domain-containing protein [Treponema sp.]
MGGAVLRGEILKTFPAALFAAFLLAGGAGGLSAEAPGADPGQALSGRPLRLKPAAEPAFFSQPESRPELSAGRSEAPSPALSILDPEALGQALTQRYIREYSAPGGIAWLNAVIRRGSIYIPFIKEEIRKRGLPAELVFLPVIESGFQPAARSKSGAVGLWQFMLNSVGPFNMKVNDMVDERRDFQKSTRSALQKLEENFRYLGNWPLALAAYNAGLGAVNRTAGRTGIRDYWKLCEKKELRDETIHYVPKFLAVAWILSQPRRFGIDCWQERTEWTNLAVGRSLALDILAAEAGIDGELLLRGNRELSYGITPQDPAYELKVPAAVLPLVEEALKRSDLSLLRYYRYTVKYGDTLSALAQHYGVSLSLIDQLNPDILNRYLKIGETIIIPAYKDVAPYRGKTAGPEAGPEIPAFGGNHLVKRGETLWSLALAYEVDPELLAEANGMTLNQILPEGKSLKVPIK